MRIIGGRLKGKKIKYLKNNTTRPLRDFVKESIFNLLVHSKVLNIKIESIDFRSLFWRWIFWNRMYFKGAKMLLLENNSAANETIKKI